MKIDIDTPNPEGSLRVQIDLLPPPPRIENTGCGSSLRVDFGQDLGL